MKLLSIILLILISITSFASPHIAYASSFKYARAMDSNIMLYKLSTDSNNLDNVLCIIEKTYFVEIISDNVDNYKVNYNGIIGYVKKNDVVPVSSTPTTPFPINIKMSVGNICNLRSTPTTHSQTSNVITSINANETNITFLGRIFSEEAIDFGGTTWYYVIYNGERGYIYNKYIKSITPIYPNTEDATLYSDSNFNTASPISEPQSIIIMILLFIPCICILFILYLPRKTHSIKSSNKKNKVIDRY